MREQVEVLSLIGDVALDDGTAHGGHLLEAHVRPTLEVMLTESPVALRRVFDSSVGLALIEIDGNAAA